MYKVRHLKSLFIRANKWRGSTGAGLLESDKGISGVEAKLLQICPHYKQLNEIFGEKATRMNFEVIDSGDVSMQDVPESMPPSNSFLNDPEIEYCPDFEIVQIENEKTQSFPCAQVSDNSGDTQSTTAPKKAKVFSQRIRKQTPKSSAAHLAAFQAERTEIVKIKLDLEKEKSEKEYALQEIKFRLEEEKTKAEIERGKAELETKRRELDLKVMEIEKEERLKILQIEKEERVQKYKIEMKYKYMSEK